MEGAHSLSFNTMVELEGAYKRFQWTIRAECEHLNSPFVSRREVFYTNPVVLTTDEHQYWLYAQNKRYRALVRTVWSPAGIILDLALPGKLTELREKRALYSSLLKIEEHETIWHAVVPRVFGEALIARVQKILGGRGKWTFDDEQPFLEVWTAHPLLVGWDEDGRPIFAQPKPKEEKKGCEEGRAESLDSSVMEEEV